MLETIEVSLLPLLLLSARDEDRRFGEEVARVSGRTLSVAATPDEAKLALSALGGQQPLVMIDIADETALEPWEAVLRELRQNDVHLINDGRFEDLRPLASSGHFGHFAIRNPIDPVEAGKHYGRLLVESGLRAGDGLAGLMKKPKASLSLTLGHSKEKQGVLEKIGTFLAAETTFSPRAATIIATAVDELLMNAVFDAPVDDRGEQQFRRVPRNTPVPLSGRHAVQLEMGTDGDYVAFTVIDGFGSLNRQKLLKHLFRSFEDDYSPDPSQAGAGIGLATTFRTGGSLVFVNEPGVKTEVTVLFKHTKSFRDFKAQFRFISVHVTPGGTT